MPTENNDSQELMSQAQYAKARGVSPPSVLYAIKSGRLVKSLTKDERGRVRIDPVLADAEWAANTQGGRGPAPQPYATGAELPIDAADYNASRAKKESYLAELARLEYEEKEGTLVKAEAVRKEAFAIARQVRDGMLNIPDRISSELAALTDQFEIHKRLTEEIRRTLATALDHQ